MRLSLKPREVPEGAQVEVSSPKKSEMQVYPISTAWCLENTQSLKESSGIVGMTVAVWTAITEDRR